MNDREIIALKEVNEAIIKRLQKIEENLRAGAYVQKESVIQALVLPDENICTISERRHGKNKVISAMVAIEKVGLIPLIGKKVKVTITELVAEPEREALK